MKKLDLILLAIFPILAVVVSLTAKANFVTSLALFFGIPSLWFSLRTPRMVAHTTLFALLFSFPFVVLIDYFAVRDQAWFIPETIFPFRLFDVIALEQFLWGFLFAYFPVILYEHFLDKGKHNLVDRRMKYLLWPLVSFVALLLILLAFHPNGLTIPYFYLTFGIVLVVLPTVSFLIAFPRLLSKYIKVGAYFFALAILYELTALTLGQWTFPGKHFIGWVSAFGFRAPLEEFIFWFVFAVVGLLSYYEFFDDDRQ